MSSSTGQPTVTRRTALAGLGAGALGVALAAQGTSAQEATADLAEHPLTGSWAAVPRAARATPSAPAPRPARAVRRDTDGMG